MKEQSRIIFIGVVYSLIVFLNCFIFLNNNFYFSFLNNNVYFNFSVSLIIHISSFLLGFIVLLKCLNIKKAYPLK